MKRWVDSLEDYRDIEKLEAENAQLKELNRALVEAIKLNCKTCGDYMCETCACYKALVKAREEKGQPPGIVVGYNFKKAREAGKMRGFRTEYDMERFADEAEGGCEPLPECPECGGQSWISYKDREGQDADGRRGWDIFCSDCQDCGHTIGTRGA